MSRLMELIDEFCPDGVTYRPVKYVATIRNGKDHKSLQEGDIPVYGSGGIMRYVNTASYDKPSVLLPRKGSLTNVFYVDQPFWNVDTVFYTVINEERALSKYFYYAMCNARIEQYGTEGARPSLTQSVLNDVKIPVPPIEVQREIVRILDSFQKLDDALTAEIEAREKQYSEVRDSLLLDDPLVAYTPFREFCESMNTGPFGSSVHKSDYVDGGCPIVNPADIVGTRIVAGKRVSQEAEDRLTRYKLKKDDIVIGRRGEMGRIGLVTDESDGYLCGTGCFFVRMNDMALPSYWSHFFGTPYAKQYLDRHAVGGTMKNLNLDILGGMPVPVPKIEQQISVIGKLDAAVSLIDTLRAERDARRKQFAYYRDKLLSFPEKVTTNG